MQETHAYVPSVPVPLTELRWTPGQVLAIVAWAAALNVGQALALQALDIGSLPGELPHFIRGVVVFAFYGAIIAPVVVSARRQGVGFRSAVGLRRVHILPMVGFALIAVFAARWFAVLWALLAAALHLKVPGGVPDVTRLFGMSPFGIALTVLVAVVIGPFVEEVVLRGVAFAQIERTNGTATALVVSSVLFGVLHLNAFEFIPLAVAGALFAWVFRVTRSLWTSVTAHALFNLVSVAVIYGLKAAHL